MRILGAFNLKLLSVGLSLFAGTVAAAQVVTTLEGSYILPAGDPAIRYRQTGHRNPVVRLQEQLAAGPARLEYDRTFGYLPSVLKALDVPVSSQTLVFSKTSFQAARIYPHSPRAIYFNDSVAVGHVRGGDLLELTATDPEAGVVFFTLSQTELEEAVELAVVKSPIVGTFYRSPSPGAPSFIEVGSVVKKGQVLCIIEAMKLMNEIESEYDGEVVKIYVENGQPVQYGERLFAIKTT